MSLDNYINKAMSQWMKGDGPHSTVAISSRVRLARNFSDYPFPGQASMKQLDEVEQKVRRWWNTGGLKSLGETEYFSVKDIPEAERQSLVDKHLVSPNMIRQGYGSVLLNQGESVSIMVNEEDHLRIQTLFSGLQLGTAWQLASQVDDLLDGSFRYAWTAELGYLTCCPTNIGTGLRASVMLHLPGLALSGQLSTVLGTIAKVGVAVRGLYGEGSESQGNIYQISNHTTLGQREEEIVEALNKINLQVIEQELDSRQLLLERDELALTDKVWRAYGTLANARVITSAEALELISSLRLGIDLEILQGPDARILQALLVFTRPGYLQKIYGQSLKPRERDLKRAQLIRELVSM
jgi:protein arginine kinase